MAMQQAACARGLRLMEDKGARYFIGRLFHQPIAAASLHLRLIMTKVAGRQARLAASSVP